MNMLMPGKLRSVRFSFIWLSKLRRRIGSVWLVIAIVAIVAPAVRASPPNLLVILTDDQGWGDLSAHGNRNLSTPHLDSLARDGAQFERFYVCPVCSPTRAEFLTGRYHTRGGVYATSAGGERLNLDETTIAETFRAAGYRTGAFGKWHNGMQYPYHPCGRGFDEFYGFCSGHWGDYFNPMLEHNGKLVQGEGYCADDFTNHCMEFMESAAREGKPFFAYLPLNIPHAPMQVPDVFWNRFKDKSLVMPHRDADREDVAHTRAALAMCENVDWNVGRLLEKLEQLQIAEDTIVVYFCDNGPNGWRWNGDMKGRKGSTDEGGVRSPLFVRWPGKIPAGTVVRPIAGAIDLLPTLADLAGIALIGKKPLDGISVAPLLTDPEQAEQWPDRTIISHWRGRVSVRNQRFRLDDQGALFDLERDPGQRHNIAAQHPQALEQLRLAQQQFKREFRNIDQDTRLFPVGAAEFKYTQLPARDAGATGNIQRSNRFPNCSFYTNWVDPDDFIYWDVEVLAPGRFQVEVYYTCRAADVGAELELSFGNSAVRATVTEAHNPPLRGMEHDRVPRPESYVKDFQPLSMGIIDLPQGEGRMILRATKMPGQQVIDFRLLMLTRVDEGTGKVE
ncbi:MAG: N-acetylgalactosamine-6-sulfatase [Pirellulaceae bacterium]|nr:MAG: N-acetylgalactosamine-6-sulfatase [Pirellulaceae bacterium]